MFYNARMVRLSSSASGLLRGLAWAAVLSLLGNPGRLAAATGAGAEPLRIAVASSFRGAVETILAAPPGQIGVGDARISSAASGVLTAQITRGAPFDLFLSADRERPEALRAAGIGTGAPVCYARGRLVLLGARDLGAALADTELSIAIANPRTAPYGRAAASVLAQGAEGADDKRRILRAANVQQALQFYDRGASDLALVARATAGERGIEIPRSWHAPIEQYALVLADGARGERAAGFVEFLRSAAGRESLAALGYEACP